VGAGSAKGRADLRKQSHNFDVVYVGNDNIAGRLYHLGSFPGVKLLKTGEALRHVGTKEETGEAYSLPSMPTVHGEVFRIRDVAIVALLDAYEGYDADDPTQGLYNRTQVESETGRMVWVYTYNGPVIADQLIESGDWCKSREVPIRRQMLR
jgi:hypothetical protein